MKQPNKKNAKEWLDIGDSEFGFAELGLKDKQSKFYSEVSFMLQQAIEKYLKGYLVYNNVKPEKVHDLGYLCKQCGKINKDMLEFYDDCKIVSQYYIPGRYPTHLPILTKKQAEEAYKITKNIIDSIKVVINL